MTLLDYLIPLFYKPLWHLFKTNDIAFYAVDPLDYEMFLSIKKHLDIKLIYIAKNKKTRDYFQRKGIPFKRYPAFPSAVIMGRHAAYKFPVQQIKKIGFDHGLYQFKRWTNVKLYNQFDVYFVSSEEQVNTAIGMGINTARAIGYPKLDKLFDGSIGSNDLQKIKEKKGLDGHKKTIIFTSTWDVAGLSAIERWIDRVGDLSDKYNVLLTAHPWTKANILTKLRKIEGAFYLEESDISSYLLLADVFVGDYNSLIGEFCALDKPIITFRVPESGRTVPDVMEMINKISYQVDNFDEIPAAIEHCLQYPEEKQKERRAANKKLFLALDGKAGERAAEFIKNIISN
jgi:CDP-glycerol glycerophosphotransferase (TagB/SpsB family)